MLIRFHFFVFLALFLTIGENHAAGDESIFDSVPRGKSLVAISRFQLIDDFNAGINRSKMETDWRTIASDGAEVTLGAERQDAINPYGGSLAIRYRLGPGGTASVFTESVGFDLSQAEGLAFLIRAEEWKTFGGKIRIWLWDLDGRKQSIELSSESLKPKNERWLVFQSSKAAYAPVDFSLFGRFEIELTDFPEAQEGKLVFDEIAFFGPGDLVFQSAKDNLKAFPNEVILPERRAELMKVEAPKEFLSAVARDTWRYFNDLVDVSTGLPVDHIRIGEATGIGSYTGPTDIALYWLASIGAMDMALISRQEAIGHIGKSLATLKRLERWEHSFFYNYYHTASLAATNHFVSTVDNGWLAAALAVVRQAFPEEFGAEASKLLSELDFSRFYDPANGQLRLGYDGNKNAFSPFHYGLLVTEARIASYVAIGKGDLKPEHWARVYRTLPEEWDWQRQIPEGTRSKLFGVPVFYGRYQYRGRKFVPSWGGSLFEFLAPTLVVDEHAFGPKSLGRNNEVATALHIEYALEEKKYPVWGIAPCAIRNGRRWDYREYGIAALGVKGYPDLGVIAPYGTFLALAARPKEAVENLRRLLTHYPDLYGEYGFYDSVELPKKQAQVNHQYLLLDQAMSFIAAVNDLKDGAIQKRFHQDSIGQKAAELLSEEIWFEEESAAEERSKEKQ